MRDALFSALNGKQPTMSAHGSRTQITLFGRSTGRLTGDRVAAPNERLGARYIDVFRHSA
jgi:hypothetical protein